MRASTPLEEECYTPAKLIVFIRTDRQLARSYGGEGEGWGGNRALWIHFSGPNYL